MILKLFIIILIFYFVIKLIYKNDKKSFKNGQQNHKGSQFNAAPEKGAVETLKSCPVCLTYFQENQGIEKNNTLYCSQKCANKN